MFLNISYLWENSRGSQVSLLAGNNCQSRVGEGVEGSSGKSKLVCNQTVQKMLNNITFLKDCPTVKVQCQRSLLEPQVIELSYLMLNRGTCTSGNRSAIGIYSPISGSVLKISKQEGPM